MQPQGLLSSFSSVGNPRTTASHSGHIDLLRLFLKLGNDLIGARSILCEPTCDYDSTEDQSQYFIYMVGLQNQRESGEVWGSFWDDLELGGGRGKRRDISLIGAKEGA